MTVFKGIIISLVGFALTVFVIVFPVYQHRSGELAGNEAATAQTLKMIATSEIQYFNTHSRTFGTFDELVKEGVPEKRFAGDAPIAYGYIFILRIAPKTTNQGSSYTLNADPHAGPWERTGRNLYIDSTTSNVHVNGNRPARVTDPVFVQ
jgi:hypothetical protein